MNSNNNIDTIPPPDGIGPPPKLVLHPPHDNHRTVDHQTNISLPSGTPLSTQPSEVLPTDELFVRLNQNRPKVQRPRAEHTMLGEEPDQL